SFSFGLEIRKWNLARFAVNLLLILIRPTRSSWLLSQELLPTFMSIHIRHLSFCCSAPASGAMGAILFIIAAWATRITEYLANRCRSGSFVAPCRLSSRCCPEEGYGAFADEIRDIAVIDSGHLNWEISIVGLSVRRPRCQEQR